MDKNKNYYIYMIKFEDGRFYIGSRQSKVHASKDVKYWGSPVTYKHLWEDASLSKTKHILKVCDSFEEMRDMESEFIKDAWKKYGDLCLNRNAAPAFHPDISKAAAPLGGKKAHEMGVGIHALTHEQLKDTGKKCAELGLGIHSEEYKNSPETKERLKNFGKKFGKHMSENGLGIHSKEFKPRRREISKKNGIENVKSKKGIFRPDLQHKRKEWGKAGNLAGAGISYKKFKFISPEGIVHEGMNYHKWCRDMGFKPQGFADIRFGRQKTTHGGWRLGD